jgi:hypothetical protein
MYYVPKVSSLMASSSFHDGGVSVDKLGTTIMRDIVFLESKKLCRLALLASGDVHGELHDEHSYLDLLWPSRKPRARCFVSWEHWDPSLCLWPHGIY